MLVQSRVGLLELLELGAEALQLSGTRAIRVAQPLAPSRFAQPRCQFGGGGDEPKGLSRDSEPEEFFSTNMDDIPDMEKLRSPVVIGGLAILVLPFLVGLIALGFAK